MKKLIIASALVALLAGCATSPDRIKAASVATGCSANPADDLARLNTLSAKQKQAAKNDVVAVLLIGVPVAKIAGKDNAKEIARLKACMG